MTDVRYPEQSEAASALTVRLQVVSANSGRPRHGCSVRLWQCADDSPAETRISDATGWADFDRLLPPAGPADWPHLHFEIDGHGGRLALPDGTGLRAYAGQARRRTDLAAAFGEGESPVIASVTGDARRGYVATRTLPVREPA